MSEKIQESLADLIKTRSVITLMVFGTVCTLSILQRVIPDTLIFAFKALLGVWVGEKAWGYIKNGGSK